MGISSNGQICYGIAFDDGYEFPWSEDKDGIEGWWRRIQGFDTTIESEIFGKKYHTKEESKRCKKYFNDMREFDKNNPLPIKLVMHCSYDYPMYIISLKESYDMAGRGFPKILDPAMFVISPEQHQLLINFCKTYNLRIGKGPKWYLSSLYG